MTTTAAPPKKDTTRSNTYGPLELFDIDRLLDDDERDIAATVRKFVDTRLKPQRRGLVRIGHAAQGTGQGVRRTRRAGHAPAGLRLRGHQRRQLRPGLPGAGGRRQRLPQLRLGAGLAVDVLDLPLRLRGTEERVAAPAGRRRRHRLLRADRAGLRLQPGRHAHPRPPRRQRLGAQRHQDVDHQRQPRRRRHRVGTDRRRHPRLPGAHGHPGIHRQRDSPEAVAARLGDLRAGARQRPTAGVGAAAARRRPGRSAVVPQRGPLRHRVRRARRRPRQPGDHDRLHPDRATCSTAAVRVTSSPRRSWPT